MQIQKTKSLEHYQIGSLLILNDRKFPEKQSIFWTCCTDVDAGKIVIAL